TSSGNRSMASMSWMNSCHLMLPLISLQRLWDVEVRDAVGAAAGYGVGAVGAEVPGGDVLVAEDAAGDFLRVRELCRQAPRVVGHARGNLAGAHFSSRRYLVPQGLQKTAPLPSKFGRSPWNLAGAGGSEPPRRPRPFKALRQPQEPRLPRADPNAGGQSV